jgi:hypothetical protein
VTPLTYGADIGATWSLVNLICVALALTWSAALLVGILRKSLRDDPEKTYSVTTLEAENQPTPYRPSKARVLATSLGAFALVVFLLTQDMTLPMVWVDAYSPLMVCFVIAQDLITLRMIYHHDSEDDSTPHTIRPAAS